MALRSRSTVRNRPFPALFSLLEPGDLENRDVRYQSLSDLLDRAADTIPEHEHSQAARALLGSGPGRWRTVSQRGGDAAANFGCGWDAYRRRRTNGTSQLDDTLDALTLALLAPVSTGPEELEGGFEGEEAPNRGTPPDPDIIPVSIGIGSAEPSGSNDPNDPHDPANPNDAHTRDDDGANDDTADDDAAPAQSSGSRSNRRRRLVAALVILFAVVTVGAVAAWVLTRDDRPSASATAPTDPANPTQPADSEPNEACELLTHEVGDLPEQADAELKEWSPRFRELASTLPAGTTACAGLMEHNVGLVVQPVSADRGRGIGAIVSSPVGEPHAVHLRHQEYWNYISSVQNSGSDMVGVPIDRADRPDGTQVVEFTRGTMVGENTDPPSFLVYGPAWDEWQRRGDLDGPMGRPVTFIYDKPGVGRVQEFTGGQLIVDYATAKIRWEPVANPASELPYPLTDSVLRSDDATTWFVDDEGHRHWIPTNNDFNCATRSGLDQYDSVPAYAIATLPVEAPFRCR